MLFVEGEGFDSKAQYEQALNDKSIIDDIKARFDLDTKEGILAAYAEVRNVRFKTKVGDNFDDYMYDLYEKVKNGTFVEKTVSTQRKGKKDSKVKPVKKTEDLKPLDPTIKKKVVKEIKRQNRVRNFLIVFLLLVATGSIGYFVKYYYDANSVDSESEDYSELKDDKYAEILKNVTPVIRKDYDDTVEIPDILDEYLALYNKNKSLIGWIKIADTIIDYPVMQTTDNEYYLKHNFNQEKDANGCIFMDYNCDVILGNDNWILYGHHMKSGKMFAILQSYANEDFYEAHKEIQFDTIYEKGTYEVMYVFRSHIYNADEVAFKYYQFIDAGSAEEFDSYMEEMDALSIIDTGVTATYGDQLLTLSTCDYQETNGRFVVVAKKIN